MADLSELTPGTVVKGILPDGAVTVMSVIPRGSDAVEVIYKDAIGHLGQQIVFRANQNELSVQPPGSHWRFAADGAQFRLAAEALRISVSYLFDPLLAVHTSHIEPLPHQITAVYGELLPRQPLRYVLADDPGAGKTIMTGLLIKELMIRGDIHRCLIVAPGSLVEQWQDELSTRFALPFEILTNDRLESARTGNALSEMPLLIARLDKLSRNADVQAKLQATEWDLIVVDEAHKLAASFSGNEINYTKRYQLGQILSQITRHFLLLTATPHNGKEADFQLFMALIDPDRFAGKFRQGVHHVDVSDLMRRLLKEKLVTFEGKPLFPERRSNTIYYTLSPEEMSLYDHVTNYVRQEFNRAEALENNGRKGTVGFALTVLQRRLASSPEAIYQSLRRRREHLEKRLHEEEARASALNTAFNTQDLPDFAEEDLTDIDEEDPEIETLEESVVDLATAARTFAEVTAEINQLRSLEEEALQARRKGNDRKWEELAGLLQSPVMYGNSRQRHKLVIFTEHRDTLAYLADRIRNILGRHEAVVTIHGGVHRDERRRLQEAFTTDPQVQILVATDAAGEGINLQRAHLMINYDLPWNPNRLEQRFGRIHRIGQTEVCELWNLVAKDTREGEVYLRLLQKLDEARTALGGQVFDILSRITFDDVPLRMLLIEAIRYGDQPEIRQRLNQVVDHAFDTKQLQLLLDKRALATNNLNESRIQDLREQMERAEARRLQPHFIEDFFLTAFRFLNGSIREREPHRYEITHAPAAIRQYARTIHFRESIMPKYERVTFERSREVIAGKPPAVLVAPGHPLIDVTIAMILERLRNLLQTGAILVDERDTGEEPRMLFLLDHAIQDARRMANGEHHIVSRQLQFVEINRKGEASLAGYAPYLDYTPLPEDAKGVVAPLLKESWLNGSLESPVLDYAITVLVPRHMQEIKERRERLIDKTKAAVHERLTQEILYWDRRAEELKDQERKGRVNTKLNSINASQKAEEFHARLDRRIAELEQERKLSPIPPTIIGAALIIPAGLMARLQGTLTRNDAGNQARETKEIELIAMNTVMARERALGNEPHDVSAERCGYDIESRNPTTGHLRFIEVKGRRADADSVIITKNEILTGLNQPDQFILAIVLIDGKQTTLHYLSQPFHHEPDFATTSVVFDLRKLLHG